MAQGVAQARHLLGLVSEQSLYNLTNRTIELEVIPACRHHGLGIIPWSPLVSGEILARLDEIWPGPGGEAPEA